MAKIVNALKELGKKCNTTAAVPNGNTVSEVIDSIATNFNISGAYVTTMTLYTTEGSVTSGVATLSNGNTIEITVTETPQSEQQ